LDPNPGIGTFIDTSVVLEGIPASDHENVLTRMDAVLNDLCEARIGTPD
jgi:hypothetical protein